MKEEELSSGDRIKIQKNSTVCYHFLRKEKHKYILFFEWGKGLLRIKKKKWEDNPFN